LANGGRLQILESGSGRGAFGTYTPGDVLKISVESGVVKYYRNGSLLYISNVAPSLPMLVDAAIFDQGGTVSNALVSNYNSGTFTANAVNAGASPTYQWLLNGSPVGTNSNTYTNTSLSNNDVVSCTLTPNITGCSAIPVSSNTITETFVQPIGLDFSIQGTAATGSCNSVIEQVKWNLSDVSNNMTVVSANSLSKFQSNGPWDAGAASWNTVSNNGYFQFTASETNKSRMAGLSTVYAGPNFTTIQYAFFLVNGGALQIYESGSPKGGFGTYSTGDVLKISVEANTVKYYKNGVLLYISQTAPSLPMLVDVSMSEVGSTIGGAQVSNYNTGTFTANVANAGTSPAYQWMLNGSPVGTNSNTYTNASLSNNDVVTCVLTPDFPACNALPVTSNTITETIVPPFGLDFSIQGTPAATSCNSVIEQVKWNLSDLSNNMTIVSTNSLSKFQTSGQWNGGAGSWNTVSNNGYFQFTATETNKSRMGGLSTSYTSSSYTTIQYAWYLVNGGSLQIYESGGYRGTFGTYTTGDVLKITVESNVIKYYKNGVLQYISGIAPALPLLVDVSIADAGGTITNAVVSNYNTGTFTANAVNAGVNPVYQWLLNGSPVGANSSTYTNASLSNNDVVSCTLTPDLSGCNSVPVVSNTITETIVAPLGLDFSIQGTPAASSCNSVIEQVKWQLANLASNMTIVSPNSLSKFQGNGWDGGAASWNTVSNNGYFQFTATETNKSRMAGLSTAYTSSSYTTIQYAWYLVNGGSLQIYESGSSRGAFGTYTTGDVLKITVESGVVKYYKNGVLLYISGVAPALPMLADVSISDQGGTVTNALISNYNAGIFTASVVNAGTSPTYQWMLNGSPVGTNSNTYTNTTLNNNDVVTCVLTPDFPACSATPITSNTITETIVPPLGLDFSIQGTPAAASCSSVIEQVKWNLSDLASNMTIVSVNSLSRFQGNGWTGGAGSWNTVSNNGYFQFTASETNKTREAGLSASYTSASNTTIQYGFYLANGGSLQIVESGSGRGAFGTYTTGDLLKISVEGNIVKYYKNGTLLYVSGVAPTLPLLADVSIFDQGGTITNALISNYNTGTFTANAVNAGVSPTYQWLLNGSPVGTNSNTYTNTSLNNNDVVSCMLTPNASGCSAVPVASNTITETIVPPLNLDFSILGTTTAANCISDIEQVKWRLSNLAGNMAIVSTNSLIKNVSNGNWDGGAASWNTVSNNGYFQFTATETSTSRMAGLSTSYTSSSYNTIQYAWYLVAGGALQIYESGSSRGGFGTYTTGDLLKITVESNAIRYYKNGALIYVSTIAPTLPLLVDVSVNNTGGTIGNAVVSNYTTGVFTANTVNAGAAPNFTWKVNGVTVQTGTSATYSNAALNDNDVVSCVLSPDLLGCTTTTYNSNTITNTVVSPFNLDFAIQGVTDPTSCGAAVIEQVKWKLANLSNNMNIVAVNGLSKYLSNGNWDGGAASWNTVSNNGYFQFTAGETSTNKMAGLSTSFTSSSFTTIQYAFYLNTGNLGIYESGVSRGGFGTYTATDVLKITVESNVVKYYKNGVLLRVSAIAPVLPLLVDVSIQNTGGTITNALVSNSNSGNFTASSANAGASPTFQWKVNGVTVQTSTSTTYSNPGLTNNDVVTCLITPNLPGCTAGSYPSNTITYITAGNSTTWTGATSTNWFTASNWSAGLPDKFTSAVIAGGTPNNPTMATDASVLDITIASGATLTISGSPNLFVYRNFTDNGTFVPGTGTVNFVSCSGPVTINSSGTNTFYNLVINAPAGVTIGSGTQQIAKVATLTSGIITQNATLTFLNGSSVTGASDASHVNGIVTKVGTGAFTFPIGDNTYYRPVAISSPGVATDVFTAQYFHANSPIAKTVRDPTLNVISTQEYWNLVRANGASNVNVTLSWNPLSGTITSLGGLHVTGWNTVLAKWKDLGNGGTTGNNSAGTVISSAPVTAFGTFTLASLTSMNVLPVKLLYFQCNKVNSSLIDIAWATSSEQNSDYFTVERSADGINFVPIGVVRAAGNSDLELSYRMADPSPLKGVSYYRLKVTDLDGGFIYSTVDMVNNVYQSNLVVYPNPTKNSLYINFNDDHAVSVSVIDNTGRVVIPHLRPLNSTIIVDVSGLQTGLYFVLIDLEDKTRVVKKIMIQN
ncbi:MAG TPA: T9SS type A sorting domain-containing protein, partial [Puia sp.]|nr:T9SS type A sorting domain-containing protein [Puia sp.]